jgi:hypothetical protein
MPARLSLSNTPDKFATFHLGDGLIAAVDEGIPKVISAPVNERLSTKSSLSRHQCYSQLRTTISSINPLLTSFALILMALKHPFTHVRRPLYLSYRADGSWLDKSTVDEVHRSIESVIRDTLS